MAYQNEKQTKTPGQDEKQRPEKRHFPEQPSFGLPNSFMTAMPVPPPPGTPNSVMRELMAPQIPDAEAEADRLSAGIRSGTPNSIRREMGSRLGSDFSSVRFHTDPESIRRNDFMGSLAYTRGSDVFFGSDGFSPSVAAHELVHTVQQGAVPGRVTQSVPFGTVQRDPEKKDDDDDNAIDFEEEARKMKLDDQEPHPEPPPPSLSNEDFFSRFFPNPQKDAEAEDKGDDNNSGIVFVEEDEDEEDPVDGAAAAAAAHDSGSKKPPEPPNSKASLPGSAGGGHNSADDLQSEGDDDTEVVDFEEEARGMDLDDSGEQTGPPRAFDYSKNRLVGDPVNDDGKNKKQKASDDDIEAVDFEEAALGMDLDEPEEQTGPPRAFDYSKNRLVGDPEIDDDKEPADGGAIAGAVPAAGNQQDDDDDDDAGELINLEDDPDYQELRRAEDSNERERREHQRLVQQIQQDCLDRQGQMRRIRALWTDLERMPDHVLQQLMNDPRGDQTRLRLLNQLNQHMTPVAFRLDVISSAFRVTELTMGQPQQLVTKDDQSLHNLLDILNRTGREMQQLEDDMQQLQQQQLQLLEAQRRAKLQHMHQQLDSIDPNLTGALARPQVQKSLLLMRQKSMLRLEELKDELQKNPEPRIQQQLQQQMDQVRKQGKALNSLTYLQDHLLFQLSRIQTYLDNPPAPHGIDIDTEMDRAEDEVISLKNNQQFIQMILELDDTTRVFKTGQTRHKLSKSPIPIDEMVKYYKAWRRVRGDDIGQSDVHGPVIGGLVAANAALPAAAAADRADAGARPGAPGAMPPAHGGMPPAPVHGAPAGAPPVRNYQGAEDDVRDLNKNVPLADIPRNALVGANDIFKLILMDNVHRYHHEPLVDNPEWYDYWDPAKSNGQYGWYTDAVAPAINGALGLYGSVTSALNTYALYEETKRKYHNQEIGGSWADTFFSGVDTFSALGKTAQGITGMAPTADASAAGAVLNLITGTADMISGFGQFGRGARAWHHINQGMDMLGPMDDPDPEKNPVRRDWNSLTEQEKLYLIFKQGRSMQKINTWSNFMKGLSGGLSFGAGVSTLVGAAPVAAGLQLGAAALNIVRVAFERGMKARLRHRVVAEHLGIDWGKEMDLVREMIKEFNPKYDMRDQFVREVILKAHGSTAATRTEAYEQIRHGRAKLLMDIANDYDHQYQVAAMKVVEAMGIHPVETDAQGRKKFAQGALDLLKEKMG